LRLVRKSGAFGLRSGVAGSCVHAPEGLEAEDLRKGVWADPALDEDWKVTKTTLIERAWRGVRGQGG